MFLDVLRRRNPQFVKAAIALHQSGDLPANCFVLDLEAVEANARLFKAEADKFGMKTFAMTKQVGRNSGFCQALMKGGISRCVAVDLACAAACLRGGLRTGHLGHLVQIPRQDAEFAASVVRPDFWTVFSAQKAREAAAASRAAGREQALLGAHSNRGRHILPRP